MSSSCLAVILAAGEGTRMLSSTPKALHTIGGLAMIDHVIAAARAAGADRLALVIGAGSDMLTEHLQKNAGDAQLFIQTERRGTAHAVLAARAALTQDIDHVLILYADTPLLAPQTLQNARTLIAQGADIAVFGFDTPHPTGYGRLIMEGERVIRIVEERDADEKTRAVTLCNGGLMAFRGAHLLSILKGIDNRNAKSEYYLTDAVEIAHRHGREVRLLPVSLQEVMGVNDRAELAKAEHAFQERMRRAMLTQGVTMIAPETVFFSFDTTLARDVIIEPHVVFGAGVRVEEGARIRAFSHLEQAHVAKGAIIGPYARLRPGTAIGAEAHIGNFVEIKNASIGAGAKINHLAYVGDATVGSGSNIGAGTITCNYDGVFKHHTMIGRDVFIGSNATLVAPVRIGDGAYTAAGSVITEDVADGAMAFGRARQVVKEGYGTAKKQALQAKKQSG